MKEIINLNNVTKIRFIEERIDTDFEYVPPKKKKGFFGKGHNGGFTNTLYSLFSRDELMTKETIEKSIDMKVVENVVYLRARQIIFSNDGSCSYVYFDNNEEMEKAFENTKSLPGIPTIIIEK